MPVSTKPNSPQLSAVQLAHKPAAYRYAERIKRERGEQRARLALSLGCLSLLSALFILAFELAWYGLLATCCALGLVFFYSVYALTRGDTRWEWRITVLAVFAPPLLLSVWAWKMTASLPASALVLPFVLQPSLLLLAGLPMLRYIAAICLNFMLIAAVLLTSNAPLMALMPALLMLLIGSVLGLNIEHRLVHHQQKLLLMRRRADQNAEKMAERDQKMRKLAFEDPLTGLANRLHLINQLRQILKNPRDEAMNSVVFLIDLDFFKTVNDQYGHAAGDALLVEIAQRFKALVRRGDLVCRLGGDEFVILIRGVEQMSQMTTVAQKILATLAEPVWYEQQQLPLGGSIGVAPWFPDLRSPASWLQAADDAMYLAKTSGRNRFVIADYQHNPQGQ